LLPALLMSVTMSWLMRPPRTISTTSRVLVGDAHALDESFCAELLRCRFGPARAPPRVHADQLEQHHVLGESSCSATSVIALPPYLMTSV
jgi:hypothetical protein